jgi:MFS family permease
VPFNYKKYLLTVLLVILAFNYTDRAALSIILQDVKGDLKLSDTQLGLLTGIAFALFYSVMGIPIARWADRGNRVTIIAITCALWSAMVVLCGVAAGFTQLMLIRIGVAVGEAGCVPPAHSLIAEHFTRAERPRAVSIYMLGAPLSVVFGYFGAGWLNQFYGWRITFMLIGLPGLVLAALAWFTLREPRREKQASHGSARAGSASEALCFDASSVEATSQLQPQPSVKEVCLTLWANKAFRHLLLAFSVMYFFGSGIWQWVPVFFVRSHGLQTGEIGTWFAIIWGGSGIGTYWGGELASRYAANNERLQLRVMAGVVASFAFICPFIFLGHNHYLAFAIMGFAAVVWRTTDGPLFATIQTLVPPHMRATSIALVFLFANLIGMGIGPLITGLLSDALRPWAGNESLRYVLMAMAPGYLWCGWHIWRASQTVTRDLQATRTHQNNVPHGDPVALNSSIELTRALS